MVLFRLTFLPSSSADVLVPARRRRRWSGRRDVERSLEIGTSEKGRRNFALDLRDGRGKWRRGTSWRGGIARKVSLLGLQHPRSLQNPVVSLSRCEIRADQVAVAFRNAVSLRKYIREREEREPWREFKRRYHADFAFRYEEFLDSRRRVQSIKSRLPISHIILIVHRQTDLSDFSFNKNLYEWLLSHTENRWFPSNAWGVKHPCTRAANTKGAFPRSSAMNVINDESDKPRGLERSKKVMNSCGSTR